MKQFMNQILSNKALLILIFLVAIALILNGVEALHPHPHI